MKTYAAENAASGCGHGFVFADFRDCGRIEQSAVELLLGAIRNHEPDHPAVWIQTDEHVAAHLEAIRQLLNERHAHHILELHGSESVPHEIHDVIRGSAADIIFDGMVGEDFAASVGSMERGYVALNVPAECSPEILRHLRRARILRLTGLCRLDGFGGAALLEGNDCLRELRVPHLVSLDRRASCLMGQLPLQDLNIGPALVHSPDACGWLASRASIEIEGLTNLTAQTARELASSAAACLSFTTALDLSEEAARHLGQFPRTLSLMELQDISVAMAAGLQGWRGDLAIQTLRLHPLAASRLQSDHGGLSLSIRFLNGPLDEQAVIALASNGGQRELRLDLSYEHKLSERAALALSNHRGKVHLSVGRVATLVAWRCLAELRGSLRVSEANLTPSLARCLSNHRGPLYLGLKKMPGLRAAELVSKHGGNDLSLQFGPGENDLKGAVGMHLAGYRGRLSLLEVESLDPETVHSLARRKGDLRIVPFRMTREMNAALAELKSMGALISSHPS